MAARKRAKSKSVKTTAVTTAVAKVVQPHGGALNAGGTPGNVGGKGAVPSIVRQASREGYYEALPFLKEIASGKHKDDTVKCPECETVIPVARLGERVAAARVMAQFGGLEKSNTVRTVSPEVKERLQKQVDYLLSTPLIADEHREQVLTEVGALWSKR